MDGSKANPLVSIITPSYNAGAYIEATIQSVMAQDYEPIEHIVIDGCSTDDTAKIVARYPDVRSISEPDRGQTDAINKGFALAKGEYINWLNADDILLPGGVRAVVECFQAHPEGDFVYGDFQLLGPNGNIVLTRSCIELDSKVLTYGRSLTAQPACFMRRSTWLELGPLDERYDFCMDLESWIRAVLAGARFVAMREPIAAVRLHGATKTSMQGHKLSQEHRMILNQYGLLPFRGIPTLNRWTYWILLLVYKSVGTAKRVVQRRDLQILAAARAVRRYNL